MAKQEHVSLIVFHYHNSCWAFSRLQHDTLHRRWAIGTVTN
jgi:hypothetical protein